MRLRSLVAAARGVMVLVLSFAGVAAAQPAGLKLEKGDHVCIIGNTLADRMQQHGWLETLIHQRFPQHELVFRNLGFSGDEVTLRLRSKNFGTPEQHLAFNKADVILVMFGYNESFAGPAGVEKFAQALDKNVKEMLGRQYNGKGAPRVVLFAPLAHEDLKSADLPDGVENNRNLKLYAEAIGKVAAANGAPFVDLFTISQGAYAKAAKPLTINGVHLSEAGDRALAPLIVEALFPGAGASPKADDATLAKVQAAVLDKNFHWYNRYRTTDGFSIYGDRADLRFVEGQTNRTVMQREMQVLDVMTANRDPRVWAAAQGRDLKADDSNIPALLPVTTNKPGKGPNGKHVFVGGEQAIGMMKVGKNLKVNLFASEEQFPVLAKPVQMAWDVKGRLWVAVWPSYPHWKPGEEMSDKLVILEDTDGDGKADKCTTFADKLHNPTGFEFWNGGVIVAQCPEIVFLKDTDGDDRADTREVLLNGLDTADTHHTSNSFTFDPGGALYFQEGTFHHTQVETPWGPTERNANAGVYRFEPRTSKFETYVAHGFANPHGHVFDRWGQDFVTDGTGSQTYWGAHFSGKTYYPQKHSKPKQVYQQRTRPCAGTEILSSGQFPDDMQGNLLVTNVIGFQGILRYKIADKEAGFEGTEAEPIVSSSDPNFRPADAEVGPDGAIYFLDWHNPLIGHMQHNLRDPSRDHAHGRVYRVTYEGRPLLAPAKIAGEPVEKLVALLADPNDRVRYRAKIELSARPTAEVLAAVKKWAQGLDKNDKEYAHHMLEALWVHQWHNVVEEGLLKRVLRSSDPRARAAATRVLCYWRDRVKEPLKLLTAQANDEHPRVRLEAVRACSFFKDAGAATEVALESVNHPQDDYLKYTLDETMKTLDRLAKKK